MRQEVRGVGSPKGNGRLGSEKKEPPAAAAPFFLLI